MLSPAAAAVAPGPDVLRDVLAVSLTGIIFYTPRYDPAGSGEIVDFTFEYLNPAAQRMMSMPEVPTVTHNQQWPHSIEHGTFAFHVDAFVSGEPREYNVNYQADGYDNYYRLAARRSGQGLLVSFTDTAAQPRSSVEMALREAQAAEKAARADAEQQRQRFYDVLLQLPAQVAVYHGPNHVYDFVNPRYQNYFPTRPLLGRSIREAVPELGDQGFFDLLDRVYRTGEPFQQQEVEIHANVADGERLEQVFNNVLFHPLRDADGRVTGVLDFTYNVTEQVQARRQVEQLNYELETRVQARTQEALALQADLLAAAQRQVREREEFYQVFEQAPVIVALLRQPEHLVHYRNPAFQALFPGRDLAGRRYAEVMPEIVAAGLISELDRVYATGRPYYGTALPVITTPPGGGAPESRYYDFSYQAYREAGAIVGISIFAYDVTEQVRARREREAQQQRLYDAFEQAPIGIAIQTGPDLVYEFHNPAYQRMVPGRKLQGRPFFGVFSEMAGTHVETLLRHVYETGKTQQEQELLIPVARADGSPELDNRYFNIVYQARRDDQGRVNGILAFVMEVTEQVRARQQIEESAQQVRALVESAPFPIGVYAVPDYRIELANETILTAWGKGFDVIGRRFADVLPELADQHIVEQLDQVRTTG